MKRFFLGLFMALDLGLICGAGFVLYSYLNHKMPSFSLPMVSKPTATAAVRTSTTTVKAIGGGLLTNTTPANDSLVRKILFTYRNSHARQVSIRADFTGWKAEPMQKGANGAWTYQAPLTPGEYAYCYTADDKTFKDPANKRTKLIGRTTVSAILVEPLPPKPSK
jgi:1,4-alpha-glucan branching enzyme